MIESEPDSIYPPLVADVDWFVQQVDDAIGDKLSSLAVYGPAVTKIYDRREHRIHFLIVMTDRDVDALLRLAKSSKAATRRRIAPPLIATVDSIQSSADVFPLEWIDIAQYHHILKGDLVLPLDRFRNSDVRSQCERDLRSLDIQLCRGILASGGRPRRIDRLEREAADTLIRVMRGINFLSGYVNQQLPMQACERCESITSVPLNGCRQAIMPGGKHDLQTCRSMVNEIAALSRWIDQWMPPPGKSAITSSDGQLPESPSSETA